MLVLRLFCACGLWVVSALIVYLVDDCGADGWFFASGMLARWVSSLAVLVICGCLVLLDLVSLVVVLIMLVFVYCVFAYSLPLFGTFSSLVCL